MRLPTSLLRERTALASLTLLVTALTVVLMPTASHGATDGTDVVIVEEPGVTVTIPDPAGTTKSEPETPMQIQGGVNCSLSPCNFNLTASSTRTITPPGGRSGQLKSYGTVYVAMYVIPGFNVVPKADYYNTSSYAFWGGSSPFNCTSVKHQDVWDIDYAAVSWSFGGSPAGTITLGSGRIGYSNTVFNTYRVSHSVQHVYLSVTGGSIHTVKYEAHGSFQFGSNFYTTDAYSSDYLWA